MESLGASSKWNDGSGGVLWCMVVQFWAAAPTTIVVRRAMFLTTLFFIRTRGLFFAQNLRTIPTSAEEQSLKF